MFSKRRPRINAEGAAVAKFSFGDSLACSARSAFEIVSARSPRPRGHTRGRGDRLNAEGAEVAKFSFGDSLACSARSAFEIVSARSPRPRGHTRGRGGDETPRTLRPQSFLSKILQRPPRARR